MPKNDVRNLKKSNCKKIFFIFHCIYTNAIVKKSLLGAITPWELAQSWLSPSPHADLVMDYVGEQAVEHHMAYTRAWS